MPGAGWLIWSGETHCSLFCTIFLCWNADSDLKPKLDRPSRHACKGKQCGNTERRPKLGQIGRGEKKPKPHNQYPHESAFTHRCSGLQLTHTLGLILGHVHCSPYNNILCRCRKDSNQLKTRLVLSQMCELHQKWMGLRKCIGTPQVFFGTGNVGKGMHVLQELSYTRAVAQARSWDKTRGSGDCTSAWGTSPARPRTSHILPPPSHLITWALQADGFQSVFIQCGSVAKETTIYKREPLASEGGKLMQITQGLKMASGPEFRRWKAFALAHVSCCRKAAVQSAAKTTFQVKSVCVCGMRKNQSLLSTSRKFTYSGKSNLTVINVLFACSSSLWNVRGQVQWFKQSREQYGVRHPQLWQNSHGTRTQVVPAVHLLAAPSLTF